MKAKRGTGNKRNGLLWGMLLLPGLLAGEVLVDFEDLALTVPPLREYTGTGGGVYYNGADGAGGFTSGGIFLETAYDEQFGSWSGWAYSTTSDVETGTFLNEFSNITGGAASGDVFAVAYYSAFGATPSIQFPGGGQTLLEAQFTNATYPYISMRDGDTFAKKFAEGDFFKMILTAYESGGSELGTVEFYLADFREETDPNDLVSEWTTVDLSPLNAGRTEAVTEIRVTFASSDVGDFGINTPTYVAMDRLVIEGGWAGYLVDANGWVDTGDFLGWVYPVSDWVWVEQVERWVHLPEPEAGFAAGGWLYLPRD